MGMVLMGHDPHLDRMAAIKVMLPSIAAKDTAKAAVPAGSADGR